MFWFKNALIYRLTKSIDWSSDFLQTKLAAEKYHPCSQQDRSKFGWSAPLKGSELLHFSANNQVLLVAHKEEKILPSTVVKSTLNERVEALEKAQSRKLKKTEKQALQDDVIAMLLPRAFSKHQHTALWIDSNTNLIYVDAASSKRAEEVLALLRKTLGSLPVVPLAFNYEPANVMRQWLLEDSLPAWFTCLEEAELVSEENKGVIRCKQQDLSSQTILAHLQNGMLVGKLGVEWEEHFSLVLSEDGTLKRIKFADMIREKNDDIAKEDFAQRFDADFLLMTGELAKFTDYLLEQFGGERERITR